MQHLMADLAHFRDERDWKKYHTPSELARAISIEASELNELFLWGSTPTLQGIREELADVMIYCLNMCIACEMDPLLIIEQKIAANRRKYPINKINPWEIKGGE